MPLNRKKGESKDYRVAEKTLIRLSMLLVLFSGCSGDFDAKAPLDKKMVIFSVLSTDREVQFVRVQTDYMPSGYDPMSYSSDNFVSDASVVITGPGKTYELRDTLLWRSDTSRYKFPLRAYYVSPFTPQRGKSYQLEVRSPSYGLAAASVVVPDQPRISITPVVAQVIDRPDRSPLGTFITFNIQLSRSTVGYLARLYLYYDVLKESEWVEEVVEIPITSADSSSYSLDIPQYPQMTSAPSTSQVAIFYRNGYYKGTLNKLNDRYRSTQVIFKWAAFVVLQADKNLFDYYASTHAGQDPFSIRLDEPMTSNVGGGVGMVGAYSLDSLVHLLPYDFWGNR